MPVSTQFRDTVVYPRDRETGRSFRVTIRSDVISAGNPDLPGCARWRRTFSRGRWVYTDLRDNTRCDERDCVREIARIAFGGDREKALAAVRAVRG